MYTWSVVNVLVVLAAPLCHGQIPKCSSWVVVGGCPLRPGKTSSLMHHWKEKSARSPSSLLVSAIMRTGRLGLTQIDFCVSRMSITDGAATFDIVRSDCSASSSEIHNLTTQMVGLGQSYRSAAVLW